MIEKETASSSQLAPQTKPSRNGCLWGIGGMIGCLIILLIIPATLIVSGVLSVGGLIGGLGSILGAGEPPRASVISSQTIVEGIQPMGELVSISVQLAKADVTVNVNQGTLNACGFKANHVVQGAVEAGIDLTQIGADNLRYDPISQTYTLTVPAPQLTSCRVDYIRQYDRSFTTCSVDWDEARLLANYEAVNQFRDDAVEGGILTRAQSEARLVLGNFVRLLTGHPVNIVFQPPAQSVIPSSCQPDMPPGWSYNSTSQIWTK